jgi:hypothetical protein
VSVHKPGSSNSKAVSTTAFWILPLISFNAHPHWPARFTSRKSQTHCAYWRVSGSRFCFVSNLSPCAWQEHGNAGRSTNTFPPASTTSSQKPAIGEEWLWARQCTCNVALRRVYETAIVEKQ